MLDLEDNSLTDQIKEIDDRRATFAQRRLLSSRHQRSPVRGMVRKIITASHDGSVRWEAALIVRDSRRRSRHIPGRPGSADGRKVTESSCTRESYRSYDWSMTEYMICRILHVCCSDDVLMRFASRYLMDPCGLYIAYNKYYNRTSSMNATNALLPPLHAPNPYFWIRPWQRQINTKESFKGINAIDIMKTAAQSIANMDYYECLMFYSSQSVIS